MGTQNFKSSMTVWRISNFKISFSPSLGESLHKSLNQTQPITCTGKNFFPIPIKPKKACLKLSNNKITSKSQD